MDMGETLTARG